MVRVNGGGLLEWYNGAAWLTVAATATYTLDEAYNASGGASAITVDAGDVTWSPTGAYSFVVDLTAATGTADGFLVENGADYFRVKRAGAGDIGVSVAAKSFGVSASGGITLAATDTSSFKVTGAELTISTETSGTLAVASAAVLDLDGVAVTLDASGGFSIDGSGAACNVSATSQDLTLSTITAGTLAVSSAALLTLSDGYKAGSTYATDLVLSDSIAEWSAFDTAFGEVSLLNAVTGLKDGYATSAGNAATVTVADTASATCYVGLYEAASGSLAGKTDGKLLYDAANARLQVGGTTAPTDTLNTMASATAGTAVVGPTERILNGTFDTDLGDWTAGANWAWGAGGTADHTAGSVETLTQAIATTSGQHYQVTVVLSAVSASNVVMTLTSSSGSETFTLSAAATYTKSFKAGAASSTLTFTPNMAFIGSITSVSFMLITPASVYALATMDSGGARSGLCSVATDDALANCFVGFGSGVLNTTGNDNSAFGRSALAANTTGYDNSAFGWYALAANTTGYSNSAFGWYALAANTTGYNNSAVGLSALAANTTGYNNSAVGFSALAANTTGYNNSAVGRSALAANTTGYENSAFGLSAGRYYGSGTDALTSATQCVYLGASSRANANAPTNEIVIGYNAIGAGSNTVTLGNTSITSTVLRGAVSATSFDATAALTGASSTLTTAGVAKSITDVLMINNSAHAADMDGTGSAILFNLTEDTGATLVDAGRIAVIAEQDLTSTASTQKSYLRFETCFEGTVAERWRIASSGALSNTAALGTAYLHIKAGTATAGQAPLKFTDGVLLATAEEGAEELDVGTRWMTPISTQREAVVGVGAAQYEAFHVTHSE